MERGEATWPSGKAGACKALIPQFESGCRLLFSNRGISKMSTKIFGLANLPVGTIGDTVQINSNGKVPEPEVRPIEIRDFGKSVKGSNLAPLNSDVAQFPKKKPFANSIIKMRNGFGKLMNHFSGINPKNMIRK